MSNIDLHSDKTPLLSNLSFTKNPDILENEANTPLFRKKTSLRMRYEAEAKVILEQLGGLEEIRLRLGLSQRKICQLLFIDPSAWSRWLKKTSHIPPHIIRALQWYLELEGKNPDWQQWRSQVLKRQPDPNWDSWKKQIENQLKQRPAAHSNSAPSEDWQRQIFQLHENNQKLEAELMKSVSIGVGWKLLLIFNTIGIIVWLFKTFL